MPELTVGQRILLHLSRYTGLISEYEVPADITQEGIAEACNISRSHAAVEIRRLKEKGLLSEDLRHIKGARNRRKAYFLTEHGIREKLAIVRFAEENGIDIAVRPAPKKGPVFVGRERELKKLEEWMNSGTTTILNIYGPSGVGKTALLRQFGRRTGTPVFIHEIREIDSLRAVVMHLADFLADRKAPRLKVSLDRGYDTGEVAYILSAEERRMLMAIIGYDSDIIRPLLSLLKGSQIRIVIITERPELIPDIDWPLEGMELSPLSLSEVAEFLREKGVDEDPKIVMQKAGGIPLLIEAFLIEKGGGSSDDVMERIIDRMPDDERRQMLMIAVSDGEIKEEMVELPLPFVIRDNGLHLHPAIRDRLLIKASEDEIHRAHIDAAGLLDSPLKRLVHFLRAGDSERATSVLRREIGEITDNHLYFVGNFINESLATTPELKLLMTGYLLQSRELGRAEKFCMDAMNNAEPESITWVRANIYRGKLSSAGMHMDAAEDYFRRAVEACRRKMYIREEAAARRELGALYLKRGKLSDAEKQLDIALDLARLVKNEFLISRIMVDMGNAKLAAKDLKGALEDYKSSLLAAGSPAKPGNTEKIAICLNKIELFEALGNLNRLAVAHMDCAQIYQKIGNGEMAEYHAHLAQNISRSAGAKAIIRRIEEEAKELGLLQ